jgi:glycosyltransferase involved in cell wall biosynthesis
VLSVVIPALNAAQTLGVQLEALVAQTYEGAWEIVVADNGSSDETADIVRAVSSGRSNVRLVDASDRRGINHARNVGAAAARGEFVLFVDADDLVMPTWLDAMARAAVTCAAVGGCLDRTVLNPARFSMPDRERSTGLQTWPGFLPWASGANCGLRTALLRELGGFDERYRSGGDDVELFWRLQLAGHEVCFVPDAVVAYQERPKLRQVARQFYRYGLQDPHLHRNFRSAGMPPGRVAAAVRAWGHLLLLAPWYWWSPGRRRQWVRSTGRRVGRIVGSVRYRTVYL